MWFITQLILTNSNWKPPMGKMWNLPCEGRCMDSEKLKVIEVSPRIGLSNSLSLLLLLIIFIKATPYWRIPLEPVRPRLERPRSSFSTTGILLHGAARCMYKWVKTQYEVEIEFVSRQSAPKGDKSNISGMIFWYLLVPIWLRIINLNMIWYNSSNIIDYHSF